MLLNKTKAQELMRADGLDALVIAYTENVMYFGDFLEVNSNVLKSRLYYLVFFTDDAHEPAYFVPHQDIADAQRKTWIKDVRPSSEYPIGGRPEVVHEKEQAVADLLRERGLTSGVIGYENASLPVDAFRRLEAAAEGFELRPASTLLARLRAVKSAEELRRIRKAMEATEAGAAAILNNARAGISEQELAALAQQACMDAGADSVDFLIVGAAANGAIIHGTPTDYRLQDGDIVRFDLGASSEGYPGDFARTFVVGSSPSEQDARRYHAVYEAVKAGIEAVRPGVTAGEVFAAQMAAGQAIDPELTREHAGHGVGLEVHEEPMIYAGSEFVLEEGMIVMIECGRYINGEGGYQLEDLVLVTQDGCKLITTLPRELILDR